MTKQDTPNVQALAEALLAHDGFLTEVGGWDALNESEKTDWLGEADAILGHLRRAGYDVIHTRAELLTVDGAAVTYRLPAERRAS